MLNVVETTANYITDVSKYALNCGKASVTPGQNPAPKVPAQPKRVVTTRVGQTLPKAQAYRGAAQTRSMYHWSTTRTDPDEEVSGDLETMRDRSWDLYKNNPLGASGIKRMATNVVGVGLWPSALIDGKRLGMDPQKAKQLGEDAEAEFRIFAKRCDLEGELSFPGIQYMALACSMLSGDIFANTPYKLRPGDVYGTKIHMIEGDRVSNPNYMPNSEKLTNGIEKDSDGRAVAYWIADRHPNSSLGIPKWKKFQVYGPNTGRRRLFQIGHKERPRQSRCIPVLASIIEPIHQHGEYRRSELDASITGNLLNVFIKADPEFALANDTTYATVEGTAAQREKRPEIHLDTGSVIYLMPGESIEQVNPTRPNARYMDFCEIVWREIGAAIEIPVEELLLYYQTSFTSAKAAIMQAWKVYLTRRRWLADCFLNGIYELFWDEAVALGKLQAPGYEDPWRRELFTRSKWNGPPRGIIHEDRGAKTAADRIASRISSRTIEAANLGNDFDLVQEQLEAEEERIRKQGGNPEIKPSQPDEEQEPDEDELDDDENIQEDE